MSKFDTLIQQYVSLSYDELLAFAWRSYRDLRDELAHPGRITGAEEDGVLTLLTAFMAADGKLSPEEHRFICDLLDRQDSYEDTLRRMRALGAQACRRKADTLADSLPASKKASFVSLCLCFMASDGVVTEDEAEFIKKLMA